MADTRAHIITQEDDDESLTMVNPTAPPSLARNRPVPLKKLVQLNLLNEPVIEDAPTPPPGYKYVPVTGHTNKYGTACKDHKRLIKISPGKAGKTYPKNKKEEEDYKKSRKLASRLMVEEQLAYIKERNASMKK